jgi:hypothetical protein
VALVRHEVEPEPLGRLLQPHLARALAPLGAQRRESRVAFEAGMDARDVEHVGARESLRVDLSPADDEAVAGAARAAVLERLVERVDDRRALEPS